MKRTFVPVFFAVLAFIPLLACDPKSSFPKSETPANQSIPSEKPLGTQPVLGPDGVPENCEIMVDGLCYQEASAACLAADCPLNQCTLLESYPGQVQCDTRIGDKP